MFVASVVSGKLYWNKKVAKATGQTSEVTKIKAEVKEIGAKKEEKQQDAKSSFNEAYAKTYRCSEREVKEISEKRK